jgi:RNA polymerase sigma-70 factor, ECF subfamily
VFIDQSGKYASSDQHVNKEPERHRSTIVYVNKVRLFSTPTWMDETALEAAFKDHYSQVYHIIFRLVGDPDEAEDLASEAFWRLWKNPPAENENLGGWLYRVGLRLGYNHLRSVRRRSHYQQQAGLETIERQPAVDPAQEVEQRQARERVRAVFRQLSLRDVQVLVLRYSGLSYKEIAAALQVADNSVGTLLARAEVRFEEKYRREEKNAPE